MRYTDTRICVPRWVSCPEIKQEQDPYRTHLYRKKKTSENNSKKAKQNKCAHVTTVHRFLPQPLLRNKMSNYFRQFHTVASRVVVVTLSLLADFLLAALNPLAARSRRTLYRRRSARRQAFESASAPFSTPRYHMPTFFAAVTQSHPSLTTTPNATHVLPLPLRGIASKISRFFWRQSPQDVADRPPRLSPCTARRANMMHFESRESSCRRRTPTNPS